jgi:hypothetical protein
MLLAWYDQGCPLFIIIPASLFLMLSLFVGEVGECNRTDCKLLALAEYLTLLSFSHPKQRCQFRMLHPLRLVLLWSCDHSFFLSHAQSAFEGTFCVCCCIINACLVLFSANRTDITALLMGNPGFMWGVIADHIFWQKYTFKFSVFKDNFHNTTSLFVLFQAWR